MMVFLRWFSKDKTLEAKWANRMGLQALRIMIARIFYWLRPFRVQPELLNLVRQVRKDGAIIIPDFLPEQEFQALEKEYGPYLETSQQLVQTHGDNKVVAYVYDKETRARFPNLYKYFHNKTLMGLVQGAERRTFAPEEGMQNLERVTFGPGDAHDDESESHTDIFFYTHKAWLYMSDVALETGPLVFYKKSHKLGGKRLGYEYRESIGANSRSRRISDQEIGDEGLEETRVICKKNTLVLANVHGFHRRIPGAPGKVREALIVSYRFNPFVSQAMLRIYRILRRPRAQPSPKPG